MNLKILKVLSFFLLLSLFATAQSRYLTRTAHVNVKSSNSLMDVEADNYQVISTLNPVSGDINFTGLLKSFEFKLGAADQVFNSKMVDVSAYPKIEFKGRIKDLSRINFNKPGNYTLEVEGVLHLWGLKRITSARGTIAVSADGSIQAQSNFIMKIEEESVEKINRIMKEKLPSVVNINTETLGVSRDIHVELALTY